MMSGTVRQIPVASHPDGPYFLRVDWAVDLGAGFTLALSDGCTAWIGEVSEDEVTSEASDSAVDRERYVDDLHRALVEGEDRRRGGGGGGGGGGASGGGGRKTEKDNYSFHLTPDHSRLSYEKTCKGILTPLGSVELQPAPDPVQLNRELISQTLKQGTALGSLNRQLGEENRQLKREHQRIVGELEQHVRHKEALERRLYSRFVTVLNQKKAKIRGLRGAVRRLQRTGHSEEEEEDGDEGEEERRDQQDLSGDRRREEEANQLVTLSQQPTLLITGRDLLCGGLPMDQSVSSDDGLV